MHTRHSVCTVYEELQALCAALMSELASQAFSGFALG